MFWLMILTPGYFYMLLSLKQKKKTNNPILLNLDSICIEKEFRKGK